MSIQPFAGPEAVISSDIESSRAQIAVKSLFLFSIALTCMLLMWLNTAQPSTQFATTWNWENSLNVDQQLCFGIAWSVLTIAIFLLVCSRKNMDLVSTGILLLIVSTNLGTSVAFVDEPSQLRTLVSLSMFVTLLAVINYSFAGWQNRWHIVRDEIDPYADNKSVFAYEKTRMRMLWLCVPLFFVWSILSTSFIVGLIVLCVYLTTRTFEAYYRRKTFAHGLARRFVLMMFVSVLASLVVPVNWYQLFSSELMNNRFGAPTVQTMFGPFTIGLWCLLAIVLFVTFGTRQQRDLTHIVTFFLLFVMSFFAFNNFAFAAVAFAIWNGPNVHAALMRLKESSNATFWTASQNVQRTVCIALICANFSLSFFIFQSVLNSKSSLSLWAEYSRVMHHKKKMQQIAPMDCFKPGSV